MINKKDILRRIDYWVDDFPTLPTIYSTLSDCLSNPRSTAIDAANIIIKDQSAASKVLKTANSSLYGFRSKIDNVSQAIFYIGFEEVKNLILAISIMDIFETTSKIKNLNPIELWKHSISVGVATRHICSLNNVRDLENCFISGVLHDIGKLLFIRNIPNDYSHVIDYAIEKGLTLRQSEVELLGITHTVAGELIAEKWRLNQGIKSAITGHHSGISSIDNDLITCSVHLANIVTKTLFLGYLNDFTIEQPNINIWTKFKMNLDEFNSIYPRIIDDFNEAMILFNIK